MKRLSEFETVQKLVDGRISRFGRAFLPARSVRYERLLAQGATWAARGLILGAILLAQTIGLRAQISLEINVGDITVDPNGPDRHVTLQVHNNGSSDANIQGLNFNVQIADGSDGAVAPPITGVDLVTSTLFQGNNSGQDSLESHPHFWNVDIFTSSGTVTLAPGSSANFATVTLDTTGFSDPATHWTFAVGNTLNGPTQFLDASVQPIPLTISDGMLAVPEPNSSMVASLLLIGLAGFWRLKKVRAAALLPSPGHRF